MTQAVATGGSSGTYSEAYTFDPAGNLTSKAGAAYTYGDPAHVHAVTQVGGAPRAGYDAVGNQTVRLVNGKLHLLTYDAENRLTGVSERSSLSATVGRSGTNVTLSWSAVSGATGYDIWRATTPYVTPGESGAVKVTTTTGTSYTDAGRIGDPSTNYYYLILATAGNCLVGVSQRLGEFDFALTPGSLLGVAAVRAVNAPRPLAPTLPAATLVDTPIATFQHDGDGNRVKATVNGATTVYVGQHYEVEGSTVRKYYSIRGQRVAMRVNGVLSYILTDHLGSTSVSVDANGVKTGATGFRPYGEVRYTTGALPTERLFTGQPRYATLGLDFYGARYYDSALGRFIQADTIVPGAGDPQALNRYSYVLNNPLRYTDPTGMFSEDDIMKYYGVKTWEEVLAIFGKGGKLDGQWGWLETLRQAKIGDEVWFNANASLTSPNAENGVQFKGAFAEDKGGHLKIRNLSGDDKQDNLLLDPDAVVRAQASTSYALFRNAPSSQLTPRLWVGEWQANKQYLHLQSVNWDYLLNPIAVSHLVESAGSTLFTAGVTAYEAGQAVALCVVPATCAGGVIMGLNAAASTTATWFLGKGTAALIEYHWRESAVYGP